MPDLFSSFDDAWRWFQAGGTLVSAEEHADAFVQGRAQFLAFHAPLRDGAAIDAVLDAQDQLADIEALRMMPEPLLHVTVRGIGWQVIAPRAAQHRQDDVSREEVSRVSARADKIVRATRRIAATLGPINVFPDALVLEVHDGGALGALRARLGEVHGVDTQGAADPTYLPHVTIAAFADASVAGALRERLPAMRDAATPATALGIDRITLGRWWFTGEDPLAEPEVDAVREWRLK